MACQWPHWVHNGSLWLSRSLFNETLGVERSLRGVVKARSWLTIFSPEASPCRAYWPAVLSKAVVKRALARVTSPRCGHRRHAHLREGNGPYRAKRRPRHDANGRPSMRSPWRRRRLSARRLAARPRSRAEAPSVSTADTPQRGKIGAFDPKGIA